MEGEESRDLSVSVPDTLDEWLTAKSAELDVSREEVLIQLVAAYRVTDEKASGELEAALTAQRTGERDQLETLERQLTQQVETLAQKIDTLVDDVRARVIQVKKETDTKAPADHTHSELTTITSLSQQVEELSEEIADVATDLDEEATRQDEATAAVREHLDEVESKLQTVARVTLDMRRQMRDTAAAKEQTKLLEELRTIAAKHDVRKAKCEGCGSPIDIALLSDPTCPGCGYLFSDIEPGRWLIRSPRLVNTRPELEAPPEAQSELDVLADVVGEPTTDGGDEQ